MREEDPKPYTSASYMQPARKVVPGHGSSVRDEDPKPACKNRIRTHPGNEVPVLLLLMIVKVLLQLTMMKMMPCSRRKAPARPPG